MSGHFRKLSVLLLATIFLAAGASSVRAQSTTAGTLGKAVAIGGAARVVMKHPLLSALGVGTVLGGAEAYHDDREVHAQAKADVGLAISQYGTPAGNDAVADLRGLIGAHSFFGPPIVTGTLATQGATNVTYDARARRIVAALGLNMQGYDRDKAQILATPGQLQRGTSTASPAPTYIQGPYTTQDNAPASVISTGNQDVVPNGGIRLATPAEERGTTTLATTGQPNTTAPPTTTIAGVNLASPDRTNHILNGDATGGGHLWPGGPGKSPFPQSWSATKIMDAVSDVATDPSIPETVQSNGRVVKDGTVDGVNIRVVLESPSQGGGIVTAFPTNIPRNSP